MIWLKVVVVVACFKLALSSHLGTLLTVATIPRNLDTWSRLDAAPVL